MGKAVGSERLGSLYSGGKVRRRREWRGLGDTLYDYGRFCGQRFNPDRNAFISGLIFRYHFSL